MMPRVLPDLTVEEENEQLNIITGSKSKLWYIESDGYANSVHWRIPTLST